MILTVGPTKLLMLPNGTTWCNKLCCYVQRIHFTNPCHSHLGLVPFWLSWTEFWLAFILCQFSWSRASAWINSIWINIPDFCYLRILSSNMAPNKSYSKTKVTLIYWYFLQVPTWLVCNSLIAGSFHNVIIIRESSCRGRYIGLEESPADLAMNLHCMALIKCYAWKSPPTNLDHCLVPYICLKLPGAVEWVMYKWPSIMLIKQGGVTCSPVLKPLLLLCYPPMAHWRRYEEGSVSEAWVAHLARPVRCMMNEGWPCVIASD